MQTVLPKNLNYNDVKPVGYPAKIKQMKFTPTAFNQSTQGVQSSDIIRFNISDNGFWDPYSAYIKIEVNVSGMDGIKDVTSNHQSAGSLQVDNNAGGFISQLIINNKGTEIERIEEYDTLSAILNDMNSSDYNRLCRQFEGLNFQNCSGGQQYQNPRFYTNNVTTTGYTPNAPYAIGVANSIQLNDVTKNTSVGAVTSIYRYEFVLGSEDGRMSLQKSNSPALIFGNSATSASLPSGFGYQTPFNVSLSAGSNEALLSKNFQQFITYKGALAQSIFADTQTFCIPILSGILGILMPKDSYKYIPMRALQDLIIEFRLNPYAMFTSGYADAFPTLSGGQTYSPMGGTINPMLSRIWRITKFEINVEMQYFEPSVENIILSQLNSDKGIIIHSQSWMLGPRYQINPNSSPNGTYQVNLGFESLKNVIWVYLPDDFNTYTFCRKQYRLSANITNMYVKVGNEYYPPLPITGHGGCCGPYSSTTNDVDLNNSEFLIQLYKCFGKFQDISTGCLVNNINFAVNDRAYDPTKTTAYTGNQNMDTALSQPIFHENRCIGKAVYAMNLETLNQDYSVISGINTINNRPFEITLKSDNTNSFTRSYTKYIFCNYDMLIQLRTSGVQILGRG